jgi:signal transduction histidine kinase
MELRRQAEELAEANRRKDEFLAMLSHELRNPLAPVLNSVQVLRQAPDDPSVVQYAGNMVERQVRHMARLIDDLLDVTRLTHGKVRLRTERTELGAMARRAAECVRPLMEERSHDFTLVPYHEAIWLEADPVRMDQVLVNLLNNAAQFTNPGGHIQ